ncbi:hypothetical protein CALCODRAFT_488947 [Calocera cornea HHB12733]|uniref:Phospholipid/glycerol acyltransferase domain-containing protein n=1 Tax=Calocera cornea HHB12733 TaxID=1353952 RepID=A0A165C1P6_9BASI|nr:hypothetical protein CALCODRAFT_488947 [Calocera cornea HHB12733]
MEKFSAYRDPGTGIHPFLPPTAPNPASARHYALLPVRAVAAVLRAALLLALATVWAAVRLLSLLLTPIPALYAPLAKGLDAALAQSCFLVLGFHITSELAAINRSKAKDLAHARWAPKGGDLIICNWVGWVEIVWFAAKYRATLVLPVAAPPAPPAAAAQGSPISSTGRRTGTGSAAISLPPPVSAQPRAPILGFRPVSLLQMLAAVGRAPPFFPRAEHQQGEPLEEIRKRAKGPVLVFPECTTTNGRALARFADVFGASTVPPKGYHVWLACVKYEAPTNLRPTLTQPTPATLPRTLLPLLASLHPQAVHLRQLNPAESPSAQTFLASSYVTEAARDPLAECAAALVAQLGRMRRTGLGWEDKVAFLEFWGRGRKRA